MGVDLVRFQKVLNSSTQTIKQASDRVSESPIKAAELMPALKRHFEELRSIGDLNDISASLAASSELELDGVRRAIGNFLRATKEAQEKAGALGAALFGNPQFEELTQNLEQVKKSLERGKRVEGSEKGPAV